MTIHVRRPPLGLESSPVFKYEYACLAHCNVLECVVGVLKGVYARGHQAWRASAQEGAQTLEEHRALNDLQLSFAHAAGKVRSLESQSLSARAAAERRDLELQQMRRELLVLHTQLKTLDVHAGSPIQ